MNNAARQKLEKIKKSQIAIEAYNAVSTEVLVAFLKKFGHKAGPGKAGRVISSLLKAAEKRGEIEKIELSHVRANTRQVKYVMTPAQLEAFQQKAIVRAAELD